MDVDFVEAEAALRAVRFAHDLGLADIHLEGDSLTVVNTLMAANCADFELAGFGPLIMEARQLSSSFHSFMVSHVRRTGNVVAHRLARLAIFSPVCVFGWKRFRLRLPRLCILILLVHNFLVFSFGLPAVVFVLHVGSVSSCRLCYSNTI
ncbi:unnamed protein product [Camellia sinensis]